MLVTGSKFFELSAGLECLPLPSSTESIINALVGQKLPKTLEDTIEDTFDNLSI